MKGIAFFGYRELKQKIDMNIQKCDVNVTVNEGTSQLIKEGVEFNK